MCLPLKLICIIFLFFQGNIQSSNQNNIDSENLTEEIIENIPENTTTENFLENDNSIVLPFWVNQNSEESEKSSPKTIPKNSNPSLKFPFEGLMKQTKRVPFFNK